jgi:hypothetical protein
VVREERRAPRRGAEVGANMGVVGGAVRRPALAGLLGQNGRGGGWYLRASRARRRVLAVVIA